MALIVNGFVRDVLQQLPMEFMAETQKLIGVRSEGSALDERNTGSSRRPTATAPARQLEGMGR